MKTYVNFFRAGANYLILLIMFTVLLLGEVRNSLYQNYCETEIALVEWYISTTMPYLRSLSIYNIYTPVSLCFNPHAGQCCRIRLVAI